MKVILLDDVAKVGRRGEVRDVSDGYARNFLIPKKLALSASAGNMKNLEHIKVQANAKADRVKSDAEALRQKIEALTLEERRQASEEGKLFGSVTAQDLVDFLEGKGVKVERRRVLLDEPIKRRRFGRRKVCKFCADKVDLVDYKDVRRLRSLVTERGKIIPRRISGSCARHQRQLTHAIKRARTVALVPYVATE